MNDLKHWHLLDARPIWVKEFAGALSRQVELQNWFPEISWTGYFKQTQRTSEHLNPPLSLKHFSLQRGFAKWPLRLVIHEGKRIADRLRRETVNESNTVLVCVSPHYAEVAESWSGPVVYYMTDLYYAWGEDPAFINYCDKRICQRANLVCPVSPRGREYLIDKANCSPEKIAISAMATRQSNVLAAPLLHPGKLPADIADLPRPIIGVIGNLARNTDWIFLNEAIARLPEYSWVFVGPTEMNVPDPAHRQIREELQARGGRVRFVGHKPYHELASYAQCVDLSLLPYRKIEPTYSGSSTRFYEHLAACRPMYATDGFAELLTKEPLVHLVFDVESFVNQVKVLAEKGFVDGVEMDRWNASHNETWEARATAMVRDIKARIS
jgi:glycosyltransferase involved in cell wall biosynthesis